MILISSIWKDKTTFKMIPASLDCPYNEVIFDPEEKILAIVSKEKKDSYHMLPKLNEFGDPVEAKSGKRPQGRLPYAEQRVALETYYEYFIRNKKDITDFIEMFSSNHGTFDYTTIINDAFNQTEEVVN